MTTRTATGMTTPTAEIPQGSLPALLTLLWLASPALPVGGFSYSEGLEAAIDAGLVHDEASASAWITDQLHLSLARADLAVVAQALPAWHALDCARLQALDAWSRQTRETAELRLQSEQMGRSLVEWLKTLQLPQFTASHLAALPQALQAPTYPVAFALALSLHTPASQPLDQALAAYAFGWAENMVQAALKGVPLGQSSGQRILLRLHHEIPLAVAHATALQDEGRQAFSPMLAILSARHETQYSRLFRS
jgi:urease accessory protein